MLLLQNKNESSANLTNFKPADKLHSLTHSVHSFLKSNSCAPSLDSDPKYSLGTEDAQRNFNVISSLTTKNVNNVNSASQVSSKYVPIFNKTIRQPSTSLPVVARSQPSLYVSSTSRSVFAKSQPSHISSTSKSNVVADKMQPSTVLANSLNDKTENNVRKCPVFKSLTISATRQADSQVQLSNTQKQPPFNKMRLNHDNEMQFTVEDNCNEQRLSGSDASNTSKRQIADLTKVKCLPSQTVSNSVMSSQDSSKQTHKRKSEVFIVTC